MNRLDLRGAFAPDGRPIAVCPHCWEVNRRALNLCGRCGADMNLLLQESGGLRATAAVQSPMPVRAAARLSPAQRLLVLFFVAALFGVQVLNVVYATLDWRRAGPPVPATPTLPITPD